MGSNEAKTQRSKNMRREEVQGTNNGVNGTSGMTKNQDGDLKVAATKAKRPGKDPCQVGQAEACAANTLETPRRPAVSGERCRIASPSERRERWRSGPV